MEDRWVAGIENLRMPVALPDGFGPRESMSFFLYNQDGHQAIARPFLDERSATGQPGSSPINDWSEMPKYHELESFDADTNAPSSNFIYDFEYFRFLVRPIWREVLSHDADGTVIDGDVSKLADVSARGAEVKVAIRGLCDDLISDEAPPMDHEVFIHLGACLLLHRTTVVYGVSQSRCPDETVDPAGLRKLRLGFWLADATHRRPCGWLAMRSLYVKVPSRFKTICNPLVRQRVGT